MGGRFLSLSKDECERLGYDGGFQPESIEKVAYLLSTLSGIFQDSDLSDKLVLKGGTALNLFHFQIPRLSVDIDLNYISSIDQKTMEKEQPAIESKLKSICKKAQINLQPPSDHYANKQFIGMYKSHFSSKEKIKIDINYLHRVTLLDPVPMDSYQLGGLESKNVQVLSLEELTAGKLCALIGRGQSRDFFDIAELSTKISSEDKALRLSYLFYAAKQPKDWRTVQEDEITLQKKNVESSLFPMISKEKKQTFGTAQECANSLTEACRSYIRPLLSLSDNEKEFFRRIREEGIIAAYLVTDNPVLKSKMEADPALLHRCSKATERSKE